MLVEPHAHFPIPHSTSFNLRKPVKFSISMKRKLSLDSFLHDREPADRQAKLPCLDLSLVQPEINEPDSIQKPSPLDSVLSVDLNAVAKWCGLGAAKPPPSSPPKSIEKYGPDQEPEESSDRGHAARTMPRLRTREGGGRGWAEC